jgi:CxC2 like cysteine cluster associated with KDZ transposases
MKVSYIVLSRVSFVDYRQLWTGKFFDKVTLQQLGLRYQLGHGGSRCPMPTPGPSNFLVFDTTGIHHVTVDFCDCTHHVFHQRTQFLRARWFPATVNRPKTVFTFDVLESFHELSLQGKTTSYDFYHSILRRSDNLELEKDVVGLPFVKSTHCADSCFLVSLS